jgi:type IV secretion system protein TrbL
MGELVESYFFWLAGLMAPAYIGLKSAMAAGVSSRQIMGAGSTTSRGGHTGSSTEGGKRRKMVEQAKHGASKIDDRVNNIGARAARSVNSKGKKFTEKSGEVAPDILKNAAPAVRAGKTTTRRAASDAKAGVSYAAGNLGESPVAWARSGIDHYREEPLISEASGGSTASDSTHSGTDESPSDTTRQSSTDVDTSPDDPADNT